MNQPFGRSRPLVVAGAVLASGVVVGAITWTTGLTWALSVDGSPPTAALSLIWFAMAVVIASGLIAAYIARRNLVARLRNSDRALGLSTRTAASLQELAGSVERVQQSVGETPTRAELNSSIEQILAEVPSREELTGSIERIQQSIERIGQSIEDVPSRAELNSAVEQILAEVPSRTELTRSVERVQHSVDATPARADLEAQIARARNQIESRVHQQQRSLDRIVRRVASGPEPAGDDGAASFSLVSGTRPKNVFVLGTGRCGTVTFSEACRHFDNYTSGHESLRGELSSERFSYPDDHIESDNRLSWFLGELGERFDPDETLYVHLTRSPEDVIASYTRRWDSGFRSNIGRAFGHGIVIRSEDWPDSEVESVVRFYVETVTANVHEFLKSRPSIAMQLEEIEAQFPEFVDRIGATGDIAAAMAELRVRHNASPSRPETGSSADESAPVPPENGSLSSP